MTERESDNLMPFRQQAATVTRIKETAAEQLNDLTKSIREIDTKIAHKQAELQQRVGETYLRGEDLKQYINMLKAKSSVYKKQRAELSALEVNIERRSTKNWILFMMNYTFSHYDHFFSLSCDLFLSSSLLYLLFLQRLNIKIWHRHWIN